MEEALRRLVNRIIIPKYKNDLPDIKIVINNLSDEHEERYGISFLKKDLNRVDKDVVNSLLDDTISLMKSLGFYNVGSMNFSNKGRAYVIGSYS
jgi:hypothetical protein